MHGEDGPRLLEQLGLRDHDGCTVADRARLNGHEETARWLEGQEAAAGGARSLAAVPVAAPDLQ